jgi:quercetin dioxygenase-like cupin family protein
LLRAAGFRIDVIYPADDPHTAILSKDRERVRLIKPDAEPLPQRMPAFQPESILTKAGASPGQGRAGMLYRDLIPGRLGGRYIASHITISGGGPVADWIHYHRIALQMIYVRRGWVRVVYEDQGEPFVMNEGDLVLQPPEIRHRVLESSAGLEVVEISAPALHETFADHATALPGGDRSDRVYSGQRFLHHVAAETPWTPFNGAEAQETAMTSATAGLCDVRTIRPRGASTIEFAPHHGELLFGFVLDGSASLNGNPLEAADAFVMQPGKPWTLSGMSADFRLLHLTTARLDGAT